MKGLICYFSNTGNTKLVCQAIAARVKNAEWVLHDLTEKTIPNLDDYDIIGLATYTDFWGPPQKVQSFLESLPSQDGNKTAFVFNAHAGESGKTLMILKDWMKSKKFKVIAGHSLATPVNFSPAIADGWINAEDPTEQAIEEFNKFILQLDNSLVQIKNGEEVPEFIVTLSEEDMSFPFAVRNMAKDDMGDIFVDENLCTNCGKCQTICPYDAIELNPYPIIDNSKCYGCWACFNNCDSKAIYTSKVRGNGHYNHPTEIFKEKLGL